MYQLEPRNDKKLCPCRQGLFFWQLAQLQRKVRSDVSSEYWLNVICAYPDRQLFDWGMMRLRRPMYGVGDPFAMDADDQLRKKRDAEVILFVNSPALLPQLLVPPFLVYIC